MFTLAALFVALIGAPAQAVVTEIPIHGNEKLIITVPQAVVNLQGASSRTLRINLGEGANDEYMISNLAGVIRIQPRDPVTKETFGRFSPKKRLIEIQGPAVPLEIHAFDGQIQLNKWNRDALVQLQKGHIISRDGNGSFQAQAQNGGIQVLDHQGRVSLDGYKAAMTVRNLNGDANIENFAGETTIDKAHGFLALSQGQGSTKVLGSGGTLQFESVKGGLNVQKFQGRVEGQTQEAPVAVTMAPDSEVNIRTQNGRITVRSAPNSGAFVNLASAEGDIYAPSYLRVNRDGSQKTLRGRLKGESHKSSIVVRSQEGTINIR